LTEKPKKLIDNIQWGIKKIILDINEAIKIFNKLKAKEKYLINKKLNIKNFVLLEKQYVKGDKGKNKEVQLNYVLKNNFFNGSYIFEFFDEEKDNVKFLLEDTKLLEKFNNEVTKILPINISNVSDRLGNIIFQLPINKFKVNISSIADRNTSPPKFKGFKINILSNSIINDLEVKLYEIYDNIVTLQKNTDIINNKAVVNIDNSFGSFIEIYDKKNKILLYKEKLNIIKNFNLNTEIPFTKRRKFFLKSENEFQYINIYDNLETFIGIEKEEYRKWIDERIYENEMNYLEKKKYFVQYWRNKQDRELPIKERHWKALKDLHYLINAYGKYGVYLWDPYLSAEDIKKTLYFCQYAYTPMKAITVLKSPNSQKQNILENMRNEFEKDDKQTLFLNLEVRAKINNYGFNFHDRFIIFPGNYRVKPKAWSLGTSINSFGKEHHILQEVKHAAHILNIFNELWNELNHPECIVWKT
jgi:hypothetical protein